ncbi:hypothetical protein RhiJN_19406 [Ceratobasidium sp. AG-Ba]|nr:hypothetical protein RhiJN_04561 [Ceratobasidium sp. AG-Ba]QRV91388.1 hypothetical protein RhiJN_19406 [Ceratobasidium sp. AG-Ba]
MKLTTSLVAFGASFAALAATQGSSSSEGIMTIQPITSIIPSSLISTPPPLSEPTRTSTRIGGSQVQPTSFTTSTAPEPSASDSTSTATASLPNATSSAISSASSAAASATTSAAPNGAIKPLVGVSAGVFGLLAALGGALLV